MAASPQLALRLATQALPFAGIRQTSCISSPVRNQLGAWTRLLGSSQQQPLPYASLSGHAGVRALHADAQQNASVPTERNKASLSVAVGAVKAAGTALTALLRRLQLLATPNNHRGESLFERYKDGVVSIFVPRRRQLLLSANQVPSGSSGSGKDTEMEVGGGTGFVMSYKGLKQTTVLLTSYHVVQGSLQPGWVKVQLSPGDEILYDAAVIGGDRALDVAVLLAAPPREKLQEMPALTLGSSSGLHIGQRVYSIGSPPTQVDKSFSAGVISGLNWTVQCADDGRDFKGAVLTNVRVSPGCSGSPLLDGTGQVVGILKGSFLDGTPSFWAPVDKVTQMLAQLRAHGGKALETMGMFVVLDGDQPGLVVTTVLPGLPAEQAGLKPTTRDCPGDRIIGIDGHPVLSYADLDHALSGKRAGDIITLDILRSHTAPAGGSGGEGSSDGAQQQHQPQRQTVTVTVGSYTAGPKSAP